MPVSLLLECRASITGSRGERVVVRSFTWCDSAQGSLGVVVSFPVTR